MNSFIRTCRKLKHFKKSKQEGWLSPTERASVSAISPRHILATSRESRQYVVAFIRFAGGGIWLLQERLRHILASAGYAHGTIAVNVTWMERGFNARQNRCSMYPSIFNCFPVIQPVSSKVGHFSIFFARFSLLWVRPWNNRVNVTWMERGFNAGQTHRSMCMPIHL